MGDEGEIAWVHLADRARVMFHLQALARLVLFQAPVSLVLGAVAAGVVGLVGGVAIGAGLLLTQTLAAVWMPSLAFDRWRYALRAEDLIVERGVWVRRTTSIPLSRIQHVDTRRGLLEQWFGLARVQVYTASGVGADGVVPGLDVDVAEALRDELVRLGGGDDGL